MSANDEDVEHSFQSYDQEHKLSESYPSIHRILKVCMFVCKALTNSTPSRFPPSHPHYQLTDDRVPAGGLFRGTVCESFLGSFLEAMFCSNFCGPIFMVFFNAVFRVILGRLMGSLLMANFLGPFL